MAKDRIIRINDNLKKIATYIQNSNLKDDLGFLSVNLDTSRDLSGQKYLFHLFRLANDELVGILMIILGGVGRACKYTPS